MKKILYLQIIILVLFILIIINYKHRFLSNEYDIMLISAMFVCIFISIGRIIKLYKNEN